MSGKKENERFQVQWVFGTGWIHTHGMADRGYPELEVRGVPDFLAEPAAAPITCLYNYMIDERVSIKPARRFKRRQEPASG
jgi:hypothetical protein